MRRQDIVSYLGNIIDVVVQLERRHGRRRVSQIMWRDRGHDLVGPTQQMESH